MSSATGIGLILFAGLYWGMIILVIGNILLDGLATTLSNMDFRRSEHRAGQFSTIAAAIKELSNVLRKQS